MKKSKIRKNSIVMNIPRYKVIVPCIMCAYMIMAMFVVGIDHKSLMLGVAAICMVLWFVGERIFPDRIYSDSVNSHNKYIYIFMGIFILMAVVSEILAKDYSDSNLIGEHDSLIAMLSYIVFFYMGYRYCYMDDIQKLLRYAVLIIAVITAIMSIVEFLDISVATWWAGDLASRNRVVLTFGNSNYYGAFCCMLIPFIMEMWIHSSGKIERTILIGLNGCLVCCVVMSKSTMAVYLMAFIVVALCIYECKAILKKWMSLVGFVGVTVLAIVILNICSDGKMLELIKISAGNTDAFVEEEQEIYDVKDIHLDGNKLVIEGNDSSFIMEYDGQFTFYDGDGNILDIENNGNIVTFTEKPYDTIAVQASFNQNVGMLYIEIDAGYKETIDFYISNDKFKGVGADGGAVDDISGEYKDLEISSLFTGRGYIWVNTLSMLDEVVLIGKGCGNFVYNFKQYDYVGLLKSQGTHNVIIDRPHIAYVIIGWIKQRVKSGRDNNVLSVGSFVSVVGFMVFSLLNDSLVVLSPYMWLFLGVNMSMQCKTKQIKNTCK